MSKIDKFLEESKKFAEDFENKLPDQGTKTKIKDVRKHFEKNKNEVEIGDKKYIIKKFGVRHTMKLVPVLGKSFLVPMSALFRQGEDEQGLNGITEGLFMLFDNIENDKLVDILEILLENTSIDGNPVDIDKDFDDIADVFNVCVKVLEINFQNFLKSLGLTELSKWAEGISKLQQ